MPCCKKKRNTKWDNAGKDVIVVHGLQRTSLIPNLSPFVLKLETYLRMAGLKYEFDSTAVFGPKGKTPWINLNGKDYGDSQLIMEMLSAEFDKNLNAHLTPEEAAISRSFQIMCDEHIFWGGLWWRWVLDPKPIALDSLNLKKYMKPIIGFIIRVKMKCRAKQQGIGLHSDEEIVEMMKKDVNAISDYLGDKPYLLGDKPCEADCSIFAMVSQVIYAMPRSPYVDYTKGEKMKNLVAYVERVKDKFWPDWDEITKATAKDN